VIPAYLSVAAAFLIGIIGAVLLCRLMWTIEAAHHTQLLDEGMISLEEWMWWRIVGARDSVVYLADYTPMPLSSPFAAGIKIPDEETTIGPEYVLLPDALPKCADDNYGDIQACAPDGSVMYFAPRQLVKILRDGKRIVVRAVDLRVGDVVNPSVKGDVNPCDATFRRVIDGDLVRRW
jgi:hypothetical protein